MATFELSPRQDSPIPAPTGWAGVETNDLLRNARWFTRIRWCLVLAIGLASAISQLLPVLFAAIGIRLPLPELHSIAGVLAASNLFYTLLLRRCTDAIPRRRLVWHLWMQIAIDLGVLSVLVHLAGSTTTFISMAYLFHIMLACIFFSPPFSLMVALLSAVLFLSVVVLELTGVLTPRSILEAAPPSPGATAAPLLQAASAIVLWLAVWALMAFVAHALRRRDRLLAKANRHLIEAEERQNQQVLRTTHDLKAPFSGIESNIQLIRALHWEQLSAPVQEIIQRIETRSAALRERVRDILTLGAIKSQEQDQITSIEEVEISSLVTEASKILEDRIASRNITLNIIGGGTGHTSPLQLKTLLVNLISNAVFYSHDGGTVMIDIKHQANDSATVSISDHGIGIRADALPHIFEEYYRSGKAAKFNAMSTGLGLAIVKRIAENLEIAIRVYSQIDCGSTFEITIPYRRAGADE